MVLDLRRVRMLTELAHRGSLGAVAVALDYSPSAVSQQLAALQRDVGATLFEPVGRGVRLTPAGEVLAERGRALLAAAEEAVSDVLTLHPESAATVRVGALQSVTRRLLVPVAGRMMREHPHTRTEVNELEVEEALPALRAGSVDLVVSDEYVHHPRPRPTGFRYRPLCDEPVDLVLSSDHPLAGRRGPIALSRLADEAWTASAPDTGQYAMLVSACRAHGNFEPDIRHRASDADVQLQLVRTTGAIALLPRLALPPDDPTLSLHAVRGTRLVRRLSVVTRAVRPAPSLRAFTALLQEHVERLGLAPTRSG